MRQGDRARRRSLIRAPSGWWAVALRAMVGYGFMAHGYAKILKGPERFVDILHVIGVPAPELMGWATIIFELVGGLGVWRETAEGTLAPLPLTGPAPEELCTALKGRLVMTRSLAG